MSEFIYQPCVCGSGKKIKFCCCKDLVTDLEKIIRAMEGGQRIGGLQQIERATKQHGARPALEYLRARLLMEGGEIDQARQTLESFHERWEPTATSWASLAATHLYSESPDVDRIHKYVQRSLEAAEGHFPHVLAQVLRDLPDLMFVRQRYAEGFGYLWLFVNLSAQVERSRGEEGLGGLGIVRRACELFPIPRLLRIAQQSDILPADDVPWKREYEVAIVTALRGAWIVSCDALESLNDKVPGQRTILKSLATIQGWAGRYEQAAQTWEAVAALPDIPALEATVAKLRSLQFKRRFAPDRTHHVTMIATVKNAEQVGERMLSDRRLMSAPTEIWPREEDQPPPRFAASLFDRPCPPEEQEVTSPDDVPRMLGACALFGRETDREARVEVAARGPVHQQLAETVLRDLLGDDLQEISVTTTENAIPLLSDVVVPIKDDVKAEQEVIRQANLQVLREACLQRWIEQPLDDLDGKSPREAASDSSLQLALAAKVLELELNFENVRDEWDFKELREALGLPPWEIPEMEPEKWKGEVHPVFWDRLDLSRLSNNALGDMAMFAVFLKHARAAVKIIEEILSRPDMVPEDRRFGWYEQLLTEHPDPAQALEKAREVKALAAKLGEPTGHWMIWEFRNLLALRRPEEAQETLQLILNEHLNEPGVAEELQELLQRLGLIRETGEGEEMPTDQPAEAPQEAAPGQEKQIWTPDAKEEAGGEQKSKLWIPGE